MKVSIDSILNNLVRDVEFKGDGNAQVSDLVRIDEGLSRANSETCIVFITDKAIGGDAELGKLSGKEIGLVITTQDIYGTIYNDRSNYILTEDPRGTFNEIIKQLHKCEMPSKVEDSAIISDSARIGNGAYIGHGVVIEDRVEIGDSTTILHNTIIRTDTRIGSHVNIGSNNTIGSRGFGYVRNDTGSFEAVLHIGNVVIEDHVEIHNNTCIDRAVLGSTIIRKGTKIDNLVHVSHGVEIGENSLIIANSMIGGSSKIGNSSWIAPSVSIINKVRIGENNLIGMGSIVAKDTADDFKGFGNPIQEIETQKKWSKIKTDLLKKIFPS